MEASPARIERVSTLELFFDLVFVFTVTELTDLLVDEPTGKGLVQVALLLAVIWWMYGGYAWLTNAVRTDRLGRRAVLLGGMAAFFVLALAVPDAFDEPGPAVGLAYLAVVLVHSTLFGRAGSVGLAAVARLTAFNVAAALSVLAGLWIGGAAAYVLLGVAILLEWGTPRLKPVEAFEVGAAHFVERHGLVIIVAIGESIIAIGLAVRESGVDVGLTFAALLGLALSAGLWFAYFDAPDHEHASEAALAGAPDDRRGRMALDAFGTWHFGLLLGIIVLAAGLKKAVAEPFDPAATAAALFMAGGLALYLASEAGFRQALGTGGPTPLRLLGLLLILATIPLGTEVAGMAQLGALVVLLTALLAAERSGASELGRDLRPQERDEVLI
jgi:low temperature requirement protein LtrA